MAAIDILLGNRFAITGNVRPFSTSAPPSQQPATGAGPTQAASFSADAIGKHMGPAYSVELSRKNDWSNPEVRSAKRTGEIECQTCKQRQYQDVSNDPGVSFKAPAHISPGASASLVQAHEQEHVGHEQAKARNEDRRVISQSVSIYTAICPECGRSYVSGGETRTVTASEPRQQVQGALGNNIDMKA